MSFFYVFNLVFAGLLTVSLNSTAWASQSDCVALLLGTADSPANKVVEAYRRILSERDTGLIEAGDLAEMQSRGASHLSGFFFLSETERSERITVSQGLKKVLAYIEGNIVDTQKLELDLRAVLEEEIKARLVHAQVGNQARDQRADLGRFKETSTGAVFEQVEWPGLGQGWKDPDGLLWKVLSESEYRNVGEVKDGKVVDSEATRACAQFGGRLPTSGEIEKFRRHFDQLRATRLSEQGLKDLHDIFPEMKNNFHWSSSINPATNIDCAFAFDAFEGSVRSVSRGKFSAAVVCVAGF